MSPCNEGLRIADIIFWSIGALPATNLAFLGREYGSLS